MIVFCVRPCMSMCCVSECVCASEHECACTCMSVRVYKCVRMTSQMADELFTIDRVSNLTIITINIVMIIIIIRPIIIFIIAMVSLSMSSI